MSGVGVPFQIRSDRASNNWFQVAPTNPKPFLQSLVQDDIIVRLKWTGYEYRGKLVSADGYMNLQLDQTEEFINGKPAGQLGQVLIRYIDSTVLQL